MTRAVRRSDNSPDSEHYTCNSAKKIANEQEEQQAAQSVDQARPPINGTQTANEECIP